MFSLETFGLSEMLQSMRSLRQLQRYATFQEQAQDVVAYYRQLFVSDSPELALVRLYRTIKQEHLPTRLHQPSNLPSTRYLTLMGTIGDEPEWCEVASSVGHQSIALSDEQTIQGIPMIAKLLDDFGLPISSVVDGALLSTKMEDDEGFSIFFVEDALTSPFIPAKDFVRDYSVASVIGFGAPLIDGEFFCVLLFSKKAVNQQLATLFRPMALIVQLLLDPLCQSSMIWMEDEDE